MENSFFLVFSRIDRVRTRERKKKKRKRKKEKKRERRKEKRKKERKKERKKDMRTSKIDLNAAFFFFATKVSKQQLSDNYERRKSFSFPFKPASITYPFFLFLSFLAPAHRSIEEKKKERKKERSNELVCLSREKERKSL